MKLKLALVSAANTAIPIMSTVDPVYSERKKSAAKCVH
jgi:hypothetical protein